jgi:hypothetical protein
LRTIVVKEDLRVKLPNPTIVVIDVSIRSSLVVLVGPRFGGGIGFAGLKQISEIIVMNQS